MLNFVCLTKKNAESIRLVKIPFLSHQSWAKKHFGMQQLKLIRVRGGGHGRDHGMDTQDLEFKFFAKRVETSYVVTATYV